MDQFAWPGYADLAATAFPTFVNRDYLKNIPIDKQYDILRVTEVSAAEALFATPLSTYSFSDVVSMYYNGVFLQGQKLVVGGQYVLNKIEGYLKPGDRYLQLLDQITGTSIYVSVERFFGFDWKGGDIVGVRTSSSASDVSEEIVMNGDGIVFERGGSPLFTGIAGSATVANSSGLQTVTAWIGNHRSTLTIGTDDAATLTFQQRWPDNSVTTLPNSLSFASVAAGGFVAQANGSYRYTLDDNGNVLVVNADSSASLVNSVAQTLHNWGVGQLASIAQVAASQYQINQAAFTTSAGGVFGQYILNPLTNTYTSLGSYQVTTSPVNYLGGSQYFGNFFDMDYTVTTGYQTGAFSQSWYTPYIDWAANHLVSPAGTVNYFNSPGWGSLSDLPIGAFYESTSPANDPAPSIAASTPRLLNASGQGLSEYGLSTYDANADGKLSGAELTNLRAWVDANENGTAETGEIRTLANAGINEIRQINYIYYAAGNAVAAPAIVAAPAKPSEAVGIGRSNVAPAVPFSNYRSLRDTDNLFQTPGGGYIAWTAGQIKINYYSQSYLIGTDGTDAFDINYYAAYDGSYFNLGLIVNFLGGGGDDTVGGSTRNDNIWGGAGNDYLLSFTAINDNFARRLAA